MQRVTDTSKGKRDASNEEANYETGEPKCVGMDLAILGMGLAILGMDFAILGLDLAILGMDLAILAKARRLTYLAVIV